MYDFGDFVTLSYISILVAKKSCEGKGKRLAPFFCRGYIQGYTRKEVRKQDTLRRLNMLLASGEFNWIALFEKLEPYLASYSDDAKARKEKDEPENIKRDLLNYIIEVDPCLHEFASDFIKTNADEKALKALKKRYGNAFAKQKRLFFKLSREFKDERDED
jgi:hypothetical protein